MTFRAVLALSAVAALLAGQAVDDGAAAGAATCSVVGGAALGAAGGAAGAGVGVASGGAAIAGTLPLAAGGFVVGGQAAYILARELGLDCAAIFDDAVAAARRAGWSAADVFRHFELRLGGSMDPLVRAVAVRFESGRVAADGFAAGGTEAASAFFRGLLDRDSGER